MEKVKEFLEDLKLLYNNEDIPIILVVFLSYVILGILLISIMKAI